MPADNTPYITVQYPGYAPARYSLTKKTTTIGRHIASDIVVPEVGIARMHAEVVETEGGHAVRSVSPTGMIAVNGAGVSGEHVLKHGDIISIGGGVSISFSCAEGPTSVPASSAVEFAGTVPPLLLAPEEAGPAPAGLVPHEPLVPSAPPVEEVPLSDKPAGDHLYEGTVLLDVRAEGKIESVVSFVRHVRKIQDMRFLRMVNKQGGVEISMGLRQPVPVKKVLEAMPEVSRVDFGAISADSQDPRFVITLGPRT